MNRPKVCPRCTIGTLRRSRRHGVEKLLSLLGVLPFRCDACTRRRFCLAPAMTP
jgi:hypothetical protein